MRLGRKLLVLAALAALGTFALGGTAPVASGVTIIHPCWDIDKSATLHSTGQPITSLTLSLDQTVQVDYAIAVTKRECAVGETPHDSVDVFDSYLGASGPGLPPGTWALHLAQSQTFRYSRDITATTCDPFDVVNTATVNNAVVLDSDTVTIRVTVACQQGCTLTQGYWKTHGDPANTKKFDTTWNLLPGGLGPSTTFFLSGASWIQVFNTSPSGNAYYQLAHQYMAARLNILNGASAPGSVTTAISSATTLFNTYTPAQIGALKGNDALRQQFISLAGTLGSYNEGTIGPGHCDE